MILKNGDEKLAIGLMSGTSADGVDAVLLAISGSGISTKVRQLSYISEPYHEDIQKHIMSVASGRFGGSLEICKLSFLLGQLFTEAALLLCKKAGVEPKEIELIGTHGQTIWHQPIAKEYYGRTITSTLQIGEPSVLAEQFPNSFVVSDFRVRDVAAGGLGAPLVPYTEFLLYRDEQNCIALQNIGGIGNITIIPAHAALSDVTAFDTGPGNMLMDALVMAYTDGKLRYDKGGAMAASGKVQEGLLAWLMQDPYLKQQPPKNTGREYYGAEYVRRILDYAGKWNVAKEDVVATVTMFTAKTIEYSLRTYCTDFPKRLIVGGGGSYNPVLLSDMKQCLPELEVMTNEELGFDSDSKEAVAFAILANETINGITNNAPSATGAKHPVIMGKITR